MYTGNDDDFFSESDYEISLRQQLEQAEQFLASKVTNCFKDKPTEVIKAIIQHDTADVLQWLMEISLAAEHYEICEAVKQITRERKQIPLSC